jgi:hypothetical protein
VLYSGGQSWASQSKNKNDNERKSCVSFHKRLLSRINKLLSHQNSWFSKRYHNGATFADIWTLIWPPLGNSGHVVISIRNARSLQGRTYQFSIHPYGST